MSVIPLFFNILDNKSTNNDYVVEILRILSILSDLDPYSFEKYLSYLGKLSEFLIYDTNESSKLIYTLSSIGSILYIEDSNFCIVINYIINLIGVL